MHFFEKILNLHRRFFRHFRLIFLFVHCLFRLFFQPIVEVLLFHLEKEIRENQALRLDRFQSFHPKYEISQILEVIFHEYEPYNMGHHTKKRPFIPYP